MPGYVMHKEELTKRLARIEGQVRGLSRMVDDERYCIDILDQISAVNRALEKVAVGLMRDHLGHCVKDAAAAGGAQATEKIEEATEAIARLLRS
jgi:DNA-binding FrmR family transcriptional regulator